MRETRAKRIGRFKKYTFCRFCKSKKLTPVINLGLVPLAGGFLKNKKVFFKEKFYPLELSFCRKCFLLQSVNVVDRVKLFKDYFYYSSAIKTLTAHFTKISREIKQFKGVNNDFFAVEIGSNDGTLIKLLKKSHIKALGIDPAENITKNLIKAGLPIINDYFSEKLAKLIVKRYGQADMICSFNTLAHIEDMHDVVRGIKILLKKRGILMFETHYLGNLINENQYDMIYHEHQYYYSLIVLTNFFSQFDMEIYDVRPISIHSGSMRYYVQNKIGGKQTVKDRVRKLLQKEKSLGLYNTSVYLKFNREVENSKKDLLSILNSLKEKNKKIVGYGASGRGTIIMNYCSLDNKYLNFIIDDAPAKQGNFVPGVHLQINPSNKLYDKNKPDYVLLFAWSFLPEIKRKHEKFLEMGGKFIVPLPKVKIINQ